MEALKKLANVTTNKPYNGFPKLAKGHHNIVSFRFVKNKFGKKAEGTNKSILVELENEVVFLPQYFCQKLNEKDISDLNSFIEAGECIYLYFGGRQKEGGWVNIFLHLIYMMSDVLKFKNYRRLVIVHITYFFRRYWI